MKALCLVTALTLLGCSQTPLLEGLSESDANDLKLRLATGGIRSHKTGQSGRFMITVADDDFESAWRRARSGGFPRPRRSKKARLVMSPSEVVVEGRRTQERALERQLLLREDVRAAAVALGADGASVTVRHSPNSQIDRGEVEALVRTLSEDEAAAVRVVLLPDTPDIEMPPEASRTPWVAGAAGGLAVLFASLFGWSRRRRAR